MESNIATALPEKGISSLSAAPAPAPAAVMEADDDEEEDEAEVESAVIVVPVAVVVSVKSGLASNTPDVSDRAWTTRSSYIGPRNVANTGVVREASRSLINELRSKALNSFRMLSQILFEAKSRRSTKKVSLLTTQ
jgi:hypothetical protein